ncbi:jg21876 [Pararge aegeria aegeria]|uniref:Jg21876 protein n=1 Tax=Pararge aegeria aegeria TaxID=348720 RepID=A0A8S4RW48_9NEOP|nr:jg21876 [Pararge aegeria aegeria]
MDPGRFKRNVRLQAACYVCTKLYQNIMFCGLAEQGNGKPLHYVPKREMVDRDSMVILSDDPANARRHLPGIGGVKYATGHVGVTHQAPHGNYAPGADSSDKILARHPQRIGTWNVRGLNQYGKLQIIEREMKRKGIHLLGLSETKWKKSGHFVSDLGNKIYFSGPEK